jgi:hypothetical protein
LHLAKSNYKFIGYREIGAVERFVLWRHDCDFSLNRSLRLAQAEHAESVKCTYFLNPHCEFYNLLERGQAQIVRNILALGHDIGLHFDAAYYAIQSEGQLDDVIAREAGWLREWFGAMPSAVSFHNPTDFLLTCERETYGGLPNCYSHTFKSTIPYISDSNGIWRFRRLWDVLETAQDPCLQVLTHPGWWQDMPLHPRQRVFRSSYGRARATMRLYDAFIETRGRPNVAGLAGSLRFLKNLDPNRYELCDYLWNSQMFESLFIELYRLHERQISQMCKAVARNKWQVAASEVNAFFEDSTPAIDGWKLFQAVFDESWAKASGCSEEAHKEWMTILKQLAHGRAYVSSKRLEEGCVYLCRVLENIATWGRMYQAIQYDGITPLGSIGITTETTADGNMSDRLEELGHGTPKCLNEEWAGVLDRIGKDPVAEANDRG